MSLVEKHIRMLAACVIAAPIVPSNKRRTTGEIEKVGIECFLIKLGSQKQGVDPEFTKPDAKKCSEDGSETGICKEEESAKAAALSLTSIGSLLELSQPSGSVGRGLLTLFPSHQL